MSTNFYPGAVTPTDRDIFFFDLNGFIVIRGALNRTEVADCNRVIDSLQHLKTGDWEGYIHGHDYDGKAGLNLQQIYEGGEAFERLIDHPNYIERVRTFVGGDGTFDYCHGPLFIDECMANIRTPGQAIPMHSGMAGCGKRTQYAVRDRKFHCGQVNVIIAYTDIGAGDGATMVVPGSHKSHFEHPDVASKSKGWGNSDSMDGVEQAVEVHLQAGDALLFVDALMHGSAARVNPGQRRISIYRYGPSWGNFRNGYRPSPELLARLSPERRKIVQPMDPVLPPVHAAV